MKDFENKFPAMTAFKARIARETKNGSEDDAVYIDGDYRFTRTHLISEFSTLSELVKELVAALEDAVAHIDVSQRDVLYILQAALTKAKYAGF